MFGKIIYREVKQILTNKLLLIIVLSISFVSMFAEYLAFEANATGIESGVFSLLILILTFFSFRYLSEYLMKLHIDQIAIITSLGIRQGQLLLGFGVFVFIASTIAFFIGSLLGGITFILLARTALAEYLNGMLDYFLFVWFRSFIFFTACMLVSLIINLFRLRHKTVQELFEQKVKNKNKPVNLKWNTTMFLLSATLLVISIIGLLAGGDLFFIAQSMISMVFISTTVFGYFLFYGIFQNLRSLFYSKKMSHLLIYNIFMKDIRKNVLVSSVLSLCLTLGFGAYLAGSILLLEDITLFQDQHFQVYFSVLQICVSVLILIIYFIILAMDIVGEFHLLKNDINILSQLGSNNQEINQTLVFVILLKFSIPAVAFWLFTIGVLPLIISNTMGLNIFLLIITFAILYHSFLLAYAFILYRGYRK